MTIRTPNYAVLDTNAAFLQWIGTAESEQAALQECANNINDPDLGTDNLRAIELTPNEATEVLDWWEHGGYSRNIPECLR